MMMQGYNLEDVTPGVDEMQIRQPLRSRPPLSWPFNFPAMVSLLVPSVCHRVWKYFHPEALRAACPCPCTAPSSFWKKTGLPKGVGKSGQRWERSSQCALRPSASPRHQFVGSTPVARHVYTRSAASGKRMQCQGGAKNHVIVLPDADMELATQIISDSAFGCAGQRCLAVSVAVTIGEAQKTLPRLHRSRRFFIRVGNGLDAGVQMGPVITRESKQRIESLVSAGVGRRRQTHSRWAQYQNPEIRVRKFSWRPRFSTILPSSSQLANTEIFGPVLSLIHANSIDEAMDFSAVALRQSGVAFHHQWLRRAQIPLRSARGKYRHQTSASPPPWPISLQRLERKFFGILHGQGRDAVEFLHRIKNRGRALVAARKPASSSHVD